MKAKALIVQFIGTDSRHHVLSHYIVGEAAASPPATLRKLPHMHVKALGTPLTSAWRYHDDS